MTMALAVSAGACAVVLIALLINHFVSRNRPEFVPEASPQQPARLSA